MVFLCNPSFEYSNYSDKTVCFLKKNHVFVDLWEQKRGTYLGQDSRTKSPPRFCTNLLLSPDSALSLIMMFFLFSLLKVYFLFCISWNETFIEHEVVKVIAGENSYLRETAIAVQSFSCTTSSRGYSSSSKPRFITEVPWWRSFVWDMWVVSVLLIQEDIRSSSRECQRKHFDSINCTLPAPACLYLPYKSKRICSHVNYSFSSNN